jgi:hypothetical protein
VHAPVVCGGKIRAVIFTRPEAGAWGLSPLDVMNAMDRYNVFLPTGDAKIGDTDYALDSNSCSTWRHPAPFRSATSPTARRGDPQGHRLQTNIVRVNGRKEVYIPIFRQLGSTLAVVNSVKDHPTSYTG